MSLESRYIQMQWKPQQMSNFIKIFTLEICSKTLLIRGRGYLFFYIIVFSLQQSIQKYSPLLGFSIIRIGEVNSILLDIIKPLQRLSNIYFYAASSSSIFILYKGLYLIVFSCYSSILRLTLGQYRDSISNFFLEKILARL